MQVQTGIGIEADAFGLDDFDGSENIDDFNMYEEDSTLQLRDGFGTAPPGFQEFAKGTHFEYANKLTILL